MASESKWQISSARQPRREDYAYDLDAALQSVVGLRARIPDDAFTADTLGTERAGNGVVIRNGVVLTIGYLITEAEEVWIMSHDGRAIPGHPLAYDQVTGFGLVQALGSLALPTMPLGKSRDAQIGTDVVVAGVGGPPHALKAKLVAKQEFAGYWEYVLDEAIFTAPAHPFWGGAAVIGPAGDLLGIGSLQLEQTTASGEAGHLNMIVPIDLLTPILQDMLETGRARRAPRPWLGIFATEIDDQVYVAGLSEDGPADAAGLQTGDMVAAVAGQKIEGLAQLFRAVWALGDAGADIPLTLIRDRNQIDIRVRSGDRDSFLKSPTMHS